MRSSPRILMLLAALVATLTIGVGGGCQPPCRVSSECETGEHCDFTTGVCKTGCTSDDDCSLTARCNLEFGNCVPTTFIGRRPNAGMDAGMDAGTSTRTSSAADGG